MARKPSAGAVFVARERLVENFGKERVFPREHLQRFRLPASNPPRGIFLPLPVERQPSQYLRTLPTFCLRRGVEAQAGLVGRLFRVEKMPGLNVEGRIIPRIHRGQERPPQLNVGTVELFGGCDPPVLTLNAQRRDDFGRLYGLRHVRNINRIGKKCASQWRGQLTLVHPQGEQRQDLAAQVLLHRFTAVNSRQEPVAFLHLLQ